MGTLNLGTGVKLSGVGSQLTITANSVLKPETPAFFAYSNTSQSIQTTGWHTATLWESTRMNIGNHFSTSTGRFTAPVTGNYIFGTQCRIDTLQSGYSRLVLSINDSTDDNFQAHAIQDSTGTTGDNYYSKTITALYNLNAGDMVKVLAYSDSDSTWQIQSESQFWGYLIG